MKRFVLAFVYALSGILRGIVEERNLRIHFVAGAVVLITAGIQGLSAIAISILVLTIGFVIAMELVNTAIERTVDLVTLERHPLAGAAKDLAAGAVLVSAITAAGVGSILFYDRLHIVAYAGIMAFMAVWILIVSYWTVKKQEDKNGI
jgi:diacylglycerol kinase